MENLNSNNVLSEVLSIDIKEYMLQNHFKPLNEERHFIYFQSPFSPEKKQQTAFLIVDRFSNTWSCKEIERQGNILDLHARLNQLSLAESLDALKNSDYPRQKPVELSSKASLKEHHPTMVISKDKIKDERILNFLKEQKLSIALAARLFQEISFTQSRIFHTGIGFTTARENPYIYVPNLGAYYMQSDHKLFDYQANTVSIFTSPLDMMHYAKITERTGTQNNILLLTDIHAFEKARPDMERHQQINLYFPKSPIAEQYNAYAQWLSPAYKDFTKTYGVHESLSKARLAGENVRQEGKKNNLNL